jgi:cob(I)alamin adenosyltransferase
MKIYTRAGDDGTTSLSGGRRVSKTDIRVEAYGSVDELIAWVGGLRGPGHPTDRDELIIYIQDQLMRCAAILASDPLNPGKKTVTPDEGSIKRLEDEIDKMELKLNPLSSFILPGGNPTVSHCHITRTVCRRAERNVLRLRESGPVPDIVPGFLNRLSDYLFVLARMLSSELDIEEIKWIVRG